MTAPGWRSAALAAGLLLLGAAAWAQDLAEGRRVALRTCQGCHGMDGIAKIPETPHLAGMDARYALRQLDAYRSGSRPHPVMSEVARGLDPAAAEAVAAYYAAIEFEVTRIPGRP